MSSIVVTPSTRNDTPINLDSYSSSASAPLPQPLALPDASKKITYYSSTSRKCSFWRVTSVIVIVAALIFGALSTSGSNSLAEPRFYPNTTHAKILDLELEKIWPDTSFEDALFHIFGGKEHLEEIRNNHKLSNDSITSSGLVVDPKAMTSPIMIGEWNQRPYIAFKYKNMNTGKVSVGSIFYYKNITWVSGINSPFRIGGNDDLSALQMYSRLLKGLPCEINKHGELDSYRLTNDNVNNA